MTQGIFPGVGAVSELSIQCSHFKMQIGAAFICSLSSPTVGSSVLVGEITAPRGTFGREWVGSTTFLCGQLSRAEQAVMKATGQPCLEGSTGTGSSGRVPDTSNAGTSSSNVSGAQVSRVRAVMSTYFADIDAADYPGAWALLTPGLQQRQGSERQFAASLSTTNDTDVRMSVLTQTTTIARLYVSFTSHQAPSDGPSGGSCDRWRLTYTLEPIAGRWLLAQTSSAGGSGYVSC